MICLSPAFCGNRCGKGPPENRARIPRETQRFIENRKIPRCKVLTESDLRVRPADTILLSGGVLGPILLLSFCTDLQRSHALSVTTTGVCRPPHPHFFFQLSDWSINNRTVDSTESRDYSERVHQQISPGSLNRSSGKN